MPRATDKRAGAAVAPRRLAVPLAAALLALSAAPARAASVAGATVTATEGLAFAGPVATFTDTATLTCPSASSYSATVTWADDTTSAAVVGPPALPALSLVTCAYPVSVDHRFAEEGLQAFTVSVSGPGGPPTSGAATADVADAPLAGLPSAPASVVAGAPVDAPVARFSDADPDATATDYTATIDWGDGTTSSDPTVAVDQGAGFAVSARHVYDRPGAYAPVVSVRDAGGSTAAAVGAITVTAPSAPAPGASPAPGAAPPPPSASVGARPPPSSGASVGPPPHLGVSFPRLATPVKFALRLTCPPVGPRCRGVARVVTAPVRARKLRLPGGATLGSAVFVLASGEARTVSVPVPARLRKVLRRAGSARLAGVVIAFGAGGHTAATTGPSAVIRTSALR